MIRELFNLPVAEDIFYSYSCAHLTLKDVMVHGRLFITDNFICFSSNVFGLETKVSPPFTN